MHKLIAVILLIYVTYIHTLPFAGVSNNNMSDIYANLASDEVYTPDQYAFNVSCLNCFSI